MDAKHHVVIRYQKWVQRHGWIHLNRVTLNGQLDLSV